MAGYLRTSINPQVDSPPFAATAAAAVSTAIPERPGPPTTGFSNEPAHSWKAYLRIFPESLEIFNLYISM